jgi:hypothetical protein
MVSNHCLNLMSRSAKTQRDFGELFLLKAVRHLHRTPTGCRPPAQGWRSAAGPTLGLAQQMSVPCRGTGRRGVTSRLRRPFRAGGLLGSGSQGSASRNPGLYAVAPLGQRKSEMTSRFPAYFFALSAPHCG